MSGSEALFQAPVLSTMLFDSLDMEGYKRALTASMEYGGLRVSRDGKGRCTPEKRQCVIDYLIEHPQCGTKEIMEACRVSKAYVYQIKRMLKG